MIAPVLMLMFFAGVDVSRAVTSSYRAGFVADTIAELVSKTDHTLSDSELTAYIQAAPLIDADILNYGRQTGNTNLSSLANIAISSIAMSKQNAACTTSCIYTAAVVFSRALAGPTRACGAQSSAADGAATTMTSLPSSVFGPVNMVVVDVQVFFKTLPAKYGPVPKLFQTLCLF